MIFGWKIKINKMFADNLSKEDIIKMMEDPQKVSMLLNFFGNVIQESKFFLNRLDDVIRDLIQSSGILITTASLILIFSLGQVGDELLNNYVFFVLPFLIISLFSFFFLLYKRKVITISDYPIVKGGIAEIISLQKSTDFYREILNKININYKLLLKIYWLLVISLIIFFTSFIVQYYYFFIFKSSLSHGFSFFYILFLLIVGIYIFLHKFKTRPNIKTYTLDK